VQLPSPPPPSLLPSSTGALARPTALAIAPDGSVVIADGDRIMRRTSDGTFSVVADISASSLAVTPDNTILAAVPGDDRVVAIARDGVVTTVATLPGVSSIAFAPDGVLYVVDESGVDARDPDGSIHRAVSNTLLDVNGTQMAFFPFTVTVDRAGNLFVADGGVKLLAEFAPDGTLLGTWGPQVYVSPGSGLAAAADGTIVLAEWGGQIERLADGIFTTVADGYRANGVAVGSDGTVYFTDGGNGWSPVAGLSAIDATGTITRLEPR
jgi:sugar lactone lactonase YvrE